MAAAAILDFYFFLILTVGTLKRAKLRRLAKFCGYRSNCRRDMAIFPTLQEGGCRHLGFLNFLKFNDRTRQEGNTVIVPNFVAIGQTVAEL